MKYHRPFLNGTCSNVSFIYIVCFTIIRIENPEKHSAAYIYQTDIVRSGKKAGEPMKITGLELIPITMCFQSPFEESFGTVGKQENNVL